MKLQAATSSQPKITKDEVGPVDFSKEKDSTGLISEGNTKIKETPSNKGPKK